MLPMHFSVAIGGRQERFPALAVDRQRDRGPDGGDSRRPRPGSVGERLHDTADRRCPKTAASGPKRHLVSPPYATKVTL